MSYQNKNIAIACNPVSKKAGLVTNSIAGFLTTMNIKHCIFNKQWPASWQSFSEVWIVGGDGTLNWFINQYPEIQIPLSIFPAGTGNDFHWMLYNDINIEAQVKKILEGKLLHVDAGLCNEKIFLNGVGIGFDGKIVKDLLGKKKLTGKVSYMFSVLKNIAGYHEKFCTLQMPGEIISQDCFMISIANGSRYGGGFRVAPKAVLTDGLLDINIVGKISPLKRIWYLPVIEKGRHVDLPFIKYRQMSNVTISSTECLHAHMDGEYLKDYTFEIQVLPKRFGFLV